MTNEITKVSAHIDYLTITLPHESPSGACSAWSACSETALRAGGLLAYRRVARVLGYLGLRSGEVFSGTRRDGQIVQVSGHLATDVFGIGWPSGSRCTRIDLAVDVSYAEYVPWVAEVTADEACQSRETGVAPANLKVVLYKGYGRGDTAYVGSRQSDKCLRVYDKDKQSKDVAYANTWRWELEAKGRAARGYYGGLKEAGSIGGWITGTVEEFIEAKGIDCGPRVGTFGGVLTIDSRGKTSDLARLEWLAYGVAPTVKRLICVFGRDRVELALGLRASVRE